MLRNAMSARDVKLPDKNYEGVRFNVICVTRGWVGDQFPGKKRHVTFDWPLMLLCDRHVSVLA